MITFAEDLDIPNYKTDLLGSYQRHNIKGVVACLQKLKGYDILPDHIVLGLKNSVKNTGLLGRWQVLQNSPRVICDTAHNKEGLQEVLKQLLTQEYQNLHIVLGFVNDKAVEHVLGLFPKSATYYFVKPNIPRGMDQKTLKKIAKKVGLTGKSFDSVTHGLEKAISKANSEDLIFVGGSTFVVAEVV